MSIVTLGARGRLVLPKALRDRLNLVGGSKLRVTIDEHDRAG
jgi:AbrB family looped-hinge helix DNA binding protein